MQRTPTLLASAAWLAAMSAACSTTVVHTEVRNTHSAFGLKDYSEVLVLALRVPANARPLRVDLEVDCEAGRVSAELVSPSGHVPWRQSVDRGGFTESLDIPAGEGEWRCRFVFENFSGSYSVALFADAGPEIEWTEIEWGIEAIEVRAPSAGEPSPSEVR